MKRFLLFSIMLTGIAVFAQDGPDSFQGIDWRNPFAAIPDPDAPVSYQNPVLPGFYSDPSVCRVGEDYYLISSTFEYFPGVPIFHSRDLVNWEQIGYCIHRREQLPQGMGIFAATLRYHEGTFYMITTNVTRPGGNFYVTATDPRGPWSDPVWVQDLKGIDPDLFFDDDGKSYVISSPMVLYEIDLASGKLLTQGRKVWNGTGGRYAEGPHIYKKDGYYYLMAAEGGTEEAHSETIARSSNIWGPYTDYRANPILAHANAAGQNLAIQGVGHADMLEAHDGSRWIVFHGYRNMAQRGPHHLLGRETCLAPVTWPENGWPVVNGNGTAPMNMTCPTLPLQPFTEKPARTEFDTENPGLEWNYIQLPDDDAYALDTEKGVLSLKGSALRIGDRESPTFVGRRLQHMSFAASASLDFDPAGENEEAGLILLNNASHFDLMINKVRNRRYLVLKLMFGRTTYASGGIPLKPGPVKLKIVGEGSTFTFSYAQGNDDYTEIETVDAKFLSSETVGGFTGVYVGFYATGNGRESKASAAYDWFEYTGN